MSRVLVVDNDPSARRVIRAIVASAGHEVEEAENGLAALKMIRLQPPEVIILDVLMPVMNGRDMFMRLKDDGKHPPVLILSAYDAERERRAIGAEASLDKPFTPEDLLEIIETLLREHPAESLEFHHQTLMLRNFQMRYWLSSEAVAAPENRPSNEATFAAHRYRVAPPLSFNKGGAEGTPLRLPAHGLRPRYPCFGHRIFHHFMVPVGMSCRKDNSSYTLERKIGDAQEVATWSTRQSRLGHL